LLPRLKEGAAWLHGNLIALAQRNQEGSLVGEVLNESTTVIGEFWEWSRKADRKSKFGFRIAQTGDRLPQLGIMYYGMVQRERQKGEDESALLDFLSTLGGIYGVLKYHD
jgi:hypothetical protein